MRGGGGGLYPYVWDRGEGRKCFSRAEECVCVGGGGSFEVV